MEPVKRWWLSLTMFMAATVTLWLLPATAWAQSGPGVALVGDELARRPRTGGSGLLGGCCCLVVVVAVVLVVMLIRRRRQPPTLPPPS